MAAIELHYPKSGQRGQQPIDLSVMLRVHVAQIAYNYSDPGMEDAFCQVELSTIPDESAILQFRHLLEKKRSGTNDLRHHQLSSERTKTLFTPRYDH